MKNGVKMGKTLKVVGDMYAFDFYRTRGSSKLKWQSQE